MDVWYINIVKTTLSQQHCHNSIVTKIIRLQRVKYDDSMILERYTQQTQTLSCICPTLCIHTGLCEHLEKVLAWSIMLQYLLHSFIGPRRLATETSNLTHAVRKRPLHAQQRSSLCYTTDTLRNIVFFVVTVLFFAFDNRLFTNEKTIIKCKEIILGNTMYEFKKTFFLQTRRLWNF